MINFNFLRISEDILDQSTTTSWLNEVIKSENKIAGDIQFVFCDDKFLLDVNKAYLDHDTFTDIITFPTSQNEMIISGEVYISQERVLDNAAHRGLEMEAELSRVMVHGILHLTGYNDKTKAGKIEMRAKEDYYLNLQS